MVMTEVKPIPRSEVDKSYKWNAESVFADKPEWEAAVETVKSKLPEIKSYKGRLAESATVLADYLDLLDSVQRLMMKAFFYAMMNASCDATDTEASAMSDVARGVFGQLAGASAFTNPELIAIGQETLLQWTQADERLSNRGQFIDDLFRMQEYVLTPDVEQVLGLVNDPFGGIQNIFGMLTNADIKFPPAVDSDGEEHEVTQGSVDTHYDNGDRSLRESAYMSYTGEYLSHKNTIAATYLTSVKRDVFFTRVRGYESSLDASLYQNNIPKAVFQNLVDTFKANIPTWHKYWDVRRRVLGLDQLQPYDIWAPLTANPPVAEFEQSVDWISAGMKPLGDDYVQALRKGCLEDRWVDRYPNKGKRPGAFSFGTYDTHPFIMMSYDNSLGAMSTLAHELGHSMHSYHSRKYQPSMYAGYTLFVAEVASNFNQAMTRAYLREAKADDTQFQIALIEEAMSNFHRYFFIMPTLARFELEVHERVERGEGVTADDLINLCADLFAEGYGDTMSFDRERIGITWATFGHLYNNYYVYQYATGISAAHELAKHILAGEAGASGRYIEFLSAGSAMYPLDALNHAGVDMTKPDAVTTTFSVLSDLVTRLEDLAGV
ncbi:MAG: oligoendopeptidase F [Aggregatilineales bacterium]